MDVEKHINYWVNAANSDHETAEILIQGGKPIEGLFFCHLCIEKMLKALVVKKIGDFPPKSHDLEYLSRKSEIILKEKDALLCRSLMIYQIEGRYPEYYPKFPAKNEVSTYLKETKDLMKWIGNQL